MSTKRALEARRARAVVSAALGALLLCAVGVAGADESLAPAGGGTVRALLVGDSWAELMWANLSLRTVFAAEGRPDLLEEGGVTAIAGSTAAEWATSGFLQLITDELVAYPEVEVVQITIGGNDLLAGQSGGGWWSGMPAGDEDALFSQVIDDVAAVVDHTLAIDPSLRVLVSVYDYPNFVDTIDLVDPFGCGDRWDDLGQPTPLEINGAMTELEARATTMLASRPRASIVSHLGLMQYVFDGIPLPGDPSLPSPIEAMLLGEDCIHLSSDGYLAIAQNLWGGFYRLHFTAIFADGFETGDTTAWSATAP